MYAAVIFGSLRSRHMLSSRMVQSGLSSPVRTRPSSTCSLNAITRSVSLPPLVTRPEPRRMRFPLPPATLRAGGRISAGIISTVHTPLPIRAAIAARMGNGVWTVEIIPAEIRPPARSVAGGSGNRIRLGSGRVTNGGNETDLVIAFNEQVLLGRVRTGELKPDCTILLESMWRESKDPKIAASYVETHDQLVKAGYQVIEIPMERECRLIVADAKRGKNMFALGMLCNIYSFDLQLGRDQIARIFGKKD